MMKMQVYYLKQRKLSGSKNDDFQSQTLVVELNEKSVETLNVTWKTRYKKSQCTRTTGKETMGIR